MDTCLGIILLALIFVPFLLLVLFFNIFGLSFQLLGLSPHAGLLLVIGSLAGSVINIPFFRREIDIAREQRAWLPWFFFRPPVVSEQIVALNVGGALIPCGLALYLMPRVAPGPAIVVTALVAGVSRLFARSKKRTGVTVPALLAPLLAGALAVLLARHQTAAVAYIGGALGTLIGAYLLNLPAVVNTSAGLLSIGGAGVYESIFLVGIVAMLLT